MSGSAPENGPGGTMRRQAREKPRSVRLRGGTRTPVTAFPMPDHSAGAGSVLAPGSGPERRHASFPEDENR